MVLICDRPKFNSKNRLSVPKDMGGKNILKANSSKKPAKKIFNLHGGKIEFEFSYLKFKFNFPAM